ncbi:MAG: efflux RND transporter periplasmic adaptor subunit [Hyphomonadaceae bacterium]|nr:efflux RND transporter periplasmic adaptor subunit [Hyphomonadaceae bacterium]
MLGLLKPPKLARAQWLWAGAAFALSAFFLWTLWPRATAVDLAIIDRGEVVREITDEGRTRIHEVFVIAAPVGGELQRIELEPGDLVVRNQVVATIAPADPALLDARVGAEARAGVGAARSALAAAEADVDLARRNQERVAALAAKSIASRAALDTANAGLRASRARAAAARSELQRAQAAASVSGVRARGRVEVRSPSPGRVLRVLQESEVVVAPGAPLIEIGDPGDLEIVAEFLSQDAIALRAGARAWIDNWGGDTPIPARISRIEPFAHTKVSALGVEEQRVNVIVRLEDPASAPPLGHQFRVDVRAVASEQDDAVRVPTDALVRDGDAWTVYRFERGRARLAPVILGEGGERYRVVTRGLKEGDRVVIFPGDTLEDGDLISADR